MDTFCQQSSGIIACRIFQLFVVLETVDIATDIFGEWWSVFRTKSKEDRLDHYNSLSKSQQSALRRSFLEGGWCYLFCQNHVDQLLDTIKRNHKLDLFDVRIKALKYNRVFLIERHIWEDIESMIKEYEPLFDSRILFGGLNIQPWGNKDKFFKISANRKEE